MIHRAAQNTIPLKQSPKPRVMVPWWNKECDAAVRDRNRAYRRLRRYPTLSHVVEYKRLRAWARIVIKTAKRNSWRKYCGTLGPETPVRKLWSAVRRMSGMNKRRPIPVLKKGDKKAVTNIEKADMLVEAFQAVHSSESLGEEKGRKRKEMMSANHWKLGRNFENDS